MLLSRRQLHALSRDPAVLWRAVLITFGAFFLTALWAGVQRPPPQTPPGILDLRNQGIRKILQADPLDRAALLRELRADARRTALWQQHAETGNAEGGAPGQLNLPRLLALSPLPASEQDAIVLWYAAIISGKVPPDLIPRMESLAMPGAPSLPRTMAADLQRLSLDYQRALASYEAAGAAPDGGEARRRAVDLALSRGWASEADRLLAQPAYYEAVHAVPDHLSEETARHQLDVRVLLRRTLAYSASVLHKTDFLLLSILTATVWFISLHKACRLPRRQWWLSLAGIPLGMFSTVVTLVLMDLQEARNGLSDSALAGPALLYQIAGVGLREEFSKLLCLLPLLWLLRKGSPAQALMAASCTGLGFALKENIMYYQSSDGSAVLGRYLTANFMHLAMTGLTGHALFRFLRYPKNFGPAFLATFCGMVMLHGFYNFSQGAYGGQLDHEISRLFPFIVGGLAWYYFQTIRQDQDRAPEALSAQAVFLLGTAVVMGTLLNFLVWENGWGMALEAFIPAVLSAAMLCWLFSHLLRDA